MNFFDILSLLGGLAMFLYGMRLMGDSLKESSSGALKLAMEKVTRKDLVTYQFKRCMSQTPERYSPDGDAVPDIP